MVEKFRKTGINIIGDVSYGVHFCQFYQTREDLIDILVPYFKAGLENNEFCMWVAQEPLSEEKAKEAMRKALPDFDQYLKRGQIEIVPHTEWYLKDGVFNLQRVLNALIDKLNQALSKGYDGIRVTGNTAWLEKRNWKSFADYEKKVNSVIGKYRMIVLCIYCLEKCGASEILDVVSNHQFALIRREGKWELIENSERKQAEEAIEQLRRQNELILNSAGEGILGLDLNGKQTFVNPAAAKLLGYEIEELIGRPGHAIWHHSKPDGASYPEEECPINAAYKDGTVNIVDCEVFWRKDGTSFPVRYISTPIREQDKIVGAVITFRDITERKRAEEQIRVSLKEKEVLLKEIHHRVKNNLQVIFSLLSLQSRNIKDKQALEMFKESQNRIKSMTLIHEKLYQSKDLARIDFAEYIKTLATDLFRSYGVSSRAINLKINVENVLLDIGTAIPCGLIINELVSNSLKHAFPAGEACGKGNESKGEIRIDLYSANTNKFTLIVSDNGVGLPKDFDFRNTTSLGLRLINTLTNQIGGTVELDRSSGITFKITFAEQKYK